MSVWALGINHTTAPLDLRGRFAVAGEALAPTLAALRKSLRGRLADASTGGSPIETAILSTCNRTEIYGAGDVGQLEPALEWLAHSGGVSPAVLRPHAYALEGGPAARHAFRVASGLDSMVLGEAQILGQMKDAVRTADEAGALGATLNQLFQRSFATAKEVRSTTEIGTQSISMAAAAVRLAGQLFEDLSEIRVLFVGAGEMIELAATHFAARNPRQIVVANRTLERGEQIAARVGGTVMPLADLPGRLHEFDVVVSSTASQLPIIGLGAVERALKARRHRPIFMVDLAVPRDIEPEVKDLEDVYLYTVDDLAHVVRTGQATRAAAVAEAEAIVDAGVTGFLHWMDERDPVRGTVPLIRELQTQADEWRAAELARARRQLARGDDVDSVLEQLSRGLAQKMLHGTLADLRSADESVRSDASAAAARFFLRGKER